MRTGAVASQLHTGPFEFGQSIKTIVGLLASIDPYGKLAHLAGGLNFKIADILVSRAQVRF